MFAYKYACVSSGEAEFRNLGCCVIVHVRGPMSDVSTIHPKKSGAW